MYRLTVVSGPTRGATYTLKDGENGIGRLGENAISLQSAKISKRHCVLVVSAPRGSFAGEITVRDEGSSNGTFVNGVLTREKKIAVGDRVSVGEFVFEVSEVAKPRPRPALVAVPALPPPPGGDVPGVYGGMTFPSGPDMAGPALATDPPPPLTDQAPSDLKGKLAWMLEKYVMPTFYSMNLKTEWRGIGVLLLGGFVVLNLVISIQPVLDTSRQAVIKEASKRAKFIAQQIAERNAPAISAKAESRADVGNIEFAETVRLAVLADLDGRIIAPAKRSGQYLTSGGEALAANRARELFRSGRETGITQAMDADTVVAVEPVLVLNPGLGRNVVAAMTVVSVDTSVSTLGLGEMGLIYSESLVLTVLIGLFVLWILYRLTLKPFEVLSDDLDRVLKGDLSQVTHEFKCEELNSFYDLINSLAQRVPKGGSSGMGAVEAEFKIEEALGALKLIGSAPGVGLAVCDANRNIVYLNEAFEEVSGIRLDANQGQALSGAARDQAFGALVSDLFDRSALLESVTEEFDFSGVGHQVSAAALMGGKAFVLQIRRNEA